jgi:hypothetical protein
MRNEGQDCDDDKQKIKHYTESNRWVSNEWGTKDKIVTTQTEDKTLHRKFFCLSYSQSCPSFLIHYSPIYYFLCSALSSVCRSHNIVLRSSFITHPSIAIDGWVMNEERRTRLWLRKQKIKHYTESNRWVSNEWGTKDKIILSFVPHSLLTHLLLSVLCFIFCLP